MAERRPRLMYTPTEVAHAQSQAVHRQGRQAGRGWRRRGGGPPPRPRPGGRGGAAEAGGVGAAPAAAAAGRSVFVRGAAAADKTLKVLQWAHFVPAYDKWFDPWAKDWGAKRGVEVTVAHVGFADVVPRATAEVAAQSGHDVHMFIGL